MRMFTETRRSMTRSFPGLLALCFVLPPHDANSAEKETPSVVQLVKTSAGYQLLRDGKPYFIKGAGGDGSLAELAEAGGNSLRTWGADKAGPILDEAQKRGISVTVGIWLGHERQGFDYNNADQVAAQFEETRRVILRYKNHPELLMWGLGNEMEGFGKGDNAAIWSAINNLAILAKKLDPNHPTMTVIAEIGGDKVKNLQRLCPDVDIVGINSYGGAPSLPKRYKEAGGVKPYVITEYGPPGIWEIPKNSWGAPPEPTSTAKAEFYRQAYEKAVLAPKGLCLGSYAFTWGHKQEATATWFGLFLPDGSRTGAIDALTELWSGHPPANRCPTIEPIKLDGPDRLEPGASLRASVAASDPDGDPIKLRWVLQREAESYGEGGDAEAVTPSFPEAIVKADDTRVELHMPRNGGGYRLFAFVNDSHNGAAMANVPLFVNGPIALAEARSAKLPLVLYDEAGNTQPYIPAGWMGNTKAMKVDQKCAENPHEGKTCLRFDYGSNEGWGGIVWQNPASDWGDRAGGFNLKGARRLTFWARGEKGGEVVSFEFGLLGRDKKYSDTAKGKLEKVKLTTEWQPFEIDLAGKDLSRIKTGFAWVVAAEGQPITFYIDDVRYE
jgi:hypothetical protein